MKTQKVKKAVFPVAGFGTRMLPITKTVPKEMLSILNIPMIQFAVEEAKSAGIEEFIFVTSLHKKVLEDYFDSCADLNQSLENKGKILELDLLKQIENTNGIFVRQKSMMGLGHAVLQARAIVGDEPFAVLLPDDLFLAEKPVLSQLIQSYEEYGGSVIGLERVELSETDKYGVVKTEKAHSEILFSLSDMHEKPAMNPFSDLAITGRYVLTANVMKELTEVKPGKGGEIQLTDAIRNVAVRSAQPRSQEPKVYGKIFEGERYDCGNRAGYLNAILNYSKRDDDLWQVVQQFIRSNVDTIQS